MRAGIKTTEFWLSLVVVALSGLVTSGYVAETHWSVKLASAIVAGAATLGYTVARAKVKVQETLNPPPAPPPSGSSRPSPS